MEKIFRTILIALLVISAVLAVWAIAVTPDTTNPAEASAIGYNLVWGYFLLGAAVVAALVSAVVGLASSPKGIKSAIFSVVAVAAVIIIAAVVASGHDIQIPDLQNNGFFGRSETVITDASILVTYVVMGLALITALYSVISDSLK